MRPFSSPPEYPSADEELIRWDLPDGFNNACVNRIRQTNPC